MASVMGINKIGLPKLSENMDPEDARALRSYLYQLQEQLQASADRDCKRLNSPAPTIKVIKTKNTCRDFHISKEFNDEKEETELTFFITERYLNNMQTLFPYKLAVALAQSIINMKYEAKAIEDGYSSLEDALAKEPELYYDLDVEGDAFAIYKLLISHTDLANSVDIVIGREPSPNVITIDKINRALDFARESAKYIADETN